MSAPGRWFEKYSATGWYLAGSMAVAAGAQYLGDQRILLADVIRVILILLFVATSVRVVVSAWEARHSDLILMTFLSVPMYVGFAAEALVHNISRFGMPPSRTLGLNLFLFAIAFWRFFVSSKIISGDLPYHGKRDLLEP
jgi:hypothetical protein